MPLYLQNFNILFCDLVNISSSDLVLILIFGSFPVVLEVLFFIVMLSSHKRFISDFLQF